MTLKEQAVKTADFLDNMAQVCGTSEWLCKPALEHAVALRAAAQEPDPVKAELLATLKAVEENWHEGGFTGPEDPRSARFSDKTLNLWRQMLAAIARAEAS